MEWWREFFGEDYFRLYSFEPEEAEAHADFLEDRVPLSPRHRILDLCCGHGRHLVELQKRGYQVTGLDLSDSQLTRAQRAAAAEELPVRVVRADVRFVPFNNAFDVVLNLFTAFGYFDDDGNEKVIAEVADSLKPHGVFVLDLPNLVYTIKHLREQGWREDPQTGQLILEEFERDLLRSRLISRKVVLVDGRRKEYSFSLREYTFAELHRMLAAHGLAVKEVYGDFAGEPLTEGSPRMIILAEKGGAGRAATSDGR